MYPCIAEREFFFDNLLIRIHLIIEMITVDRSCAMGVFQVALHLPSSFSQICLDVEIQDTHRP